MNLDSELRAVSAAAQAKASSEVLATLQAAQDSLSGSGIAGRALQPGEPLPDFELPDATGRRVALRDLLAQGPVLLSFYRGEWCPYCNLALRALQAYLPHYRSHGVQLMALSPEQPDHSLTMAQKHALGFPVLSDAGLAVARRFGIVFTLDERLRPLYQGWGVDLPARNGSDSFELPLPAAFLAGRDGIVREAFVDADYRRRLEPDAALGWIIRHFA